MPVEIKIDDIDVLETGSLIINPGVKLITIGYEGAQARLHVYKSAEDIQRTNAPELHRPFNFAVTKNCVLNGQIGLHPQFQLIASMRDAPTPNVGIYELNYMITTYLPRR